IRFPGYRAATGWAFEEYSRRFGDFAIVGVAAVVGLHTDGTVADSRVVVAGVGSAPVRAVGAESVLAGQAPSPALWTAAAEQAASDLDPPSDIHGSTAYRRRLAVNLITRALGAADRRAS